MSHRLELFGLPLGWNEGEHEKYNKDYPTLFLKNHMGLFSLSLWSDRFSLNWGLPWIRSGSQKRKKNWEKNKTCDSLFVYQLKSASFPGPLWNKWSFFWKYCSYSGVPWISLFLGQSQETKFGNKPRKLTTILVILWIVLSVPKLLVNI